MKLPYKPANILHRHGGRVVEITGIGHQTDRPQQGFSRDYWYYIGRVEWDDGKSSSGHIAPGYLCSDTQAGMDEINAVSELMMEYLRKHGEWCDSKSKHEGWYAHREKRVAA